MVHLFSCWSSKPCTMLLLSTFNVESQVPHKHISANCEKFSSEWFKISSSNYSHTLLAGVQLMKKVQLKITSNSVKVAQRVFPVKVAQRVFPVKVAQWVFQVPITCYKNRSYIIIITDQGEHQNSSMSIILQKIRCKRTAEKTHQGYAWCGCVRIGAFFFTHDLTSCWKELNSKSSMWVWKMENPWWSWSLHEPDSATTNNMKFMFQARWKMFNVHCAKPELWQKWGPPIGINLATVWIMLGLSSSLSD